MEAIVNNSSEKTVLKQQVLLDADKMVIANASIKDIIFVTVCER